MFKRKDRAPVCPPVEDKPSPILTRSLTVSDSEADSQGRLRPGALLRALQDAGALHAEELGIGHRFIRSRGALWVIVRTAMEIQRLPLAGDVCTVLTWPGETRRVFMPRFFELLSPQGETLLRARSEYLLISAVDRKMLNPLELGIRIPAATRPGELDSPARRVPFPEALPPIESRAPRYSELDINGHLNNSRYVDWAEDLLPLDYHREHTLRSLWVEYRTEVLPEDTLSLRSAREGDTLYLLGESGRGVHFSLRAQYEAQEKS